MVLAARLWRQNSVPIEYQYIELRGKNQLEIGNPICSIGKLQPLVETFADAESLPLHYIGMGPNGK
jgi:hypothetical protein